jgi:hypothetical protein
MKNTPVKRGYLAGSGKREKSGRSNGAWWNTPPSYGEMLWV